MEDRIGSVGHVHSKVRRTRCIREWPGSNIINPTRKSEDSTDVESWLIPGEETFSRSHNKETRTILGTRCDREGRSFKDTQHRNWLYIDYRSYVFVVIVSFGQFLFLVKRVAKGWSREGRDGVISGGEYIPAFKLHFRNQRTQDGEGHLRRWSSCAYESQVGIFS